MARKRTPQVSSESMKEAMGIARARQRPNQTKEQTRLIARGIADGIAEYKKSQKAKARELNRRLKNAGESGSEPPGDQLAPGDPRAASRLPWILLFVSWTGFAIYIGLTW